MAGYKGTTELIKTEKSRYLSPFEQMERWFEDMWHRPFSLKPSWHDKEVAEFETVSPFVDVYEEGNDLVFRADMPGIERKDIDISINGNMLTVSGERKHEEKVEKGNYYRYERSHGTFFRRFELPSDVNGEKANAHLENGVLTVRLPRSEEVKRKSRKVEIS